MEKLYIVCWGSGSCDDRGNAHAYAGVHSVYTSKAKALKGLVECKDQTVSELKDDLVDDEEFLDLVDDEEFSDIVDDLDIKVYGSEAEEHFEVDYTIGDEPCEVYIKIEEKELN